MQQNTVVVSKLNSPLIPVVSLSFFAIASGFLMSLIPLALQARGLPVTLASWLASMFYAGLLIGSLFSAKLVGRLGHRYSLAGFLAVIVATIGLMTIVADAWIWLAARFIAGIAVAGVFVAIESWLLIADTEKARAKRLGLYMASLYGGSALGQLGIGLFGTSGALPLMIVAGLMVGAILPPLLLPQSQPQQIQHACIKVNEMKQLPSAAYIGCIVSGLVMGSIYGLLPVELTRSYRHDEIGALMAVVILGGMLIQPLVSWLNSRVDKSLLMALFCLFGLLATAIIEIASNFIGTVAGLFLLGASAFALYPIAITLACRNLDSSKIVAAAELMLLSYSVGSVIGPLVAGRAMAIKTGLMPYLMLCFAATFIYMLFSTKRNRLRGKEIINSGSTHI